MNFLVFVSSSRRPVVVHRSESWSGRVESIAWTWAGFGSYWSGSWPRTLCWSGSWFYSRSTSVGSDE